MHYFYRILGLFIASFLTTANLVGQEFDGYALYNELNEQTTFLIDKDGAIAHSWSLAVNCNYAVLLKDDGNIVRGGVNSGNQINGAAVGGMIQEIDPSGNVVWEFIYSDANHVSHHDIALMPNGHVLMIAWEVKTSAELIQAGFDGNATRYATHIIEVEQNGTGGQIVWEWHVFDHMVQDFDNAKDNFGVVADHPELLNVNVATSGGGGGPGGGSDWFHVNGIDYNADLDQIAFSSRFLSEIFIIDHSTTTAEAASHSGGNSGKGGDFLYRWGNPANYGAPGAQIIPGPVHDVRWIKDGRPNAGYLQIFNNEGDNGNSTIDAINPPLNGNNYDLTAGQAYAPATFDWRHECLDNGTGQSASDRMPNGNTFVCLSREYLYEVDENDNVIWQYNAGPAKAFRYLCDDPGIVALLGADPCGLVGIDENEALKNISFFPNPSEGIFELKGLNPADHIEYIQLTDVFGRAIPVQMDGLNLDLSTQPVGVYMLTLKLENKGTLTQRLSLIH